MSEAIACPQGSTEHRLPWWWGRPYCLKCDYEGGMRQLKADAANMQTANRPALQTTPDSETANTVAVQTEAANLCACGKPARPRGADCWSCYRRRRS